MGTCNAKAKDVGGCESEVRKLKTKLRDRKRTSYGRESLSDQKIA